MQLGGCPRQTRAALLAGALALAGCCNPPTVAMQGVGDFAPPPFLAATDFQGGFNPAPGPVNFGLQSTYDGTIVVTMLDRTLVEPLLPASFSLAKAVNPSETRHPVIYLIGKQRDPSTVYQGTASPIMTASDYREMILLVPFVVRPPGDRWHSFAVRMYLDDFSAVQGGNTVYGYAKEWAQLGESTTAQGVTHQVTNLFSTTTYFVADLQRGSFAAIDQATAVPPRWGDIQRILGMPILGDNGSGFVCSYWEWETGVAQIASATSQHRFVTPFRGGMLGWVGLGTMASAADGAVALTGVRWRLAPPPGCAF